MNTKGLVELIIVLNIGKDRKLKAYIQQLVLMHLTFLVDTTVRY